MAVASGLSAQIGIAQEVTPGTAVAPSRFYEFVSESLSLEKETVEGEGLAAGGLYRRASRRVQTTRTVAGEIELELPTKGLGLLLHNMLGSFTTAATQVGVTTAYEQVHVPGSLQGKTFSVQKGVPDISGNVEPFTYAGCKVTEWELSVETGAIAMLTVNVDAWDELTTATTPAGPALGVASYAAGAENFHFRQGTLLLGGTVSTVGGVTSISGGTTAASVRSATVSGENPLNTERFFLGSAGVKAEQIENEWRSLSGELEAEFVSRSAVYDAFRADTATAMELLFEGNTIEGANKDTLSIILPSIRFDGSSPNVEGPDVVSLARPYTAHSDGTNPAVQIRYVSTDTSV